MADLPRFLTANKGIDVPSRTSSFGIKIRELDATHETSAPASFAAHIEVIRSCPQSTARVRRRIISTSAECQEKQ